MMQRAKLSTKVPNKRKITIKSKNILMKKKKINKENNLQVFNINFD